jgi:deoxyribodipyrimidine photo-lyase
MSYSIHWFRRDLRLQDNQALTAASEHSNGRVIPLFIVDPALVQSSRVGVNRLAFLASRLRTLHAELVARGSGLLIAYGEPRHVLLAIAAQYGATMITFERDTGPWGRQRDREVAQALLAHGLTGQTSQTLTILPPTTLKTGAGTPYTVFTPFYRAWRNTLNLTDAFDVPPLSKHPNQPAEPLWPDWPDSDVPLPDSSRAHAESLLRQFAKNAINDYTIGRDMVAKPGTSRLSPYLRFGILSPQECVRCALAHIPQVTGAERSGAEVWLSELAWRDFYHQIMYHFPHVTKSSFRPVYDAIQWGNNPDWFAAWCNGRTGYPIVDAAMRQLNQEGWMHNRARMIVSSFLTKDLLIDWRWGELPITVVGNGPLGLVRMRSRTFVSSTRSAKGRSSTPMVPTSKSTSPNYGMYRPSLSMHRGYSKVSTCAMRGSPWVLSIRTRLSIMRHNAKQHWPCMLPSNHNYHAPRHSGTEHLHHLLSVRASLAAPPSLHGHILR